VTLQEREEQDERDERRAEQRHPNLEAQARRTFDGPGASDDY
jgi:hypothetical protein